MRALVLHLTATLALATQAACVSVIGGDGAFTVNGRILGTDVPPDCQIQLFENKTALKPLDWRKISGEYKVTFIVAPHASTYTVKVACGAEVLRSVQARYGAEVTFEKPLQMPVVRVGQDSGT